MKCKSCNKRFAANQEAPAPGGFASPGVMLILTLLCATAAAVLLLANIKTIWCPILAVAALLACTQIFSSWSYCRHGQGPAGEDVKGQCCPKCGTLNKVFPWSI